jgi:predicted RNase H-like nuclease (RuvC/YqgF family)
METQTIVLVLVSLCGGAALVMLASAYRSISTKVNVTDYEINRIEKQRDDDEKFRDLNLELDNLRSEYHKEVDRLENELDKFDRRIDSRADKLNQKIEEVATIATTKLTK